MCSFGGENLYITIMKGTTSTYDHRLVKTGHPVRSAILKHQIGRSVVEWVTISESLLLYVFFFCFDIVGCCGADDFCSAGLWAGFEVEARKLQRPTPAQLTVIDAPMTS